MNKNLMPCCIRDCDEGGQYEVSGNGKVLYFCLEHVREFAEAHVAEGGTINEGDDDED